LSIRDDLNAGTTDKQHVKIVGDTDETGELECAANFDVTNQDVSCTVTARLSVIGPYTCVKWRSAGSNNLDFTKVSRIANAVELNSIHMKLSWVPITLLM
jgi:hypothetical protein